MGARLRMYIVNGGPDIRNSKVDPVFDILTEKTNRGLRPFNRELCDDDSFWVEPESPFIVVGLNDPSDLHLGAILMQLHQLIPHRIISGFNREY